MASSVVFGPGSVKTANIPVSIAPAGMTAQIQLTMATGMDTNGNPTGVVVQTAWKSFTTTGASQTIAVPVTMPSGADAGKSLYAFVDVTAGGYLLIAIVDPVSVLVPGGSAGVIVWS